MIRFGFAPNFAAHGASSRYSLKMTAKNWSKNWVKRLKMRAICPNRMRRWSICSSCLAATVRVLRALDMYVDRDIPILGINLGRLGFLLETQTQELPDALDMLVRGEYAIERRMMLKVEGMCNGKPVSAYATNEVSVSRGLSQRMIALDALVGGTLVDHYIADGVVLASPTGSTAYSLSAGGPIVSPDVPCFVLNPICPHSLQSRPIVLSAAEQVTLLLNMKEMRDGIQLSIDGQAVSRMRNGERLTVTRSPHDAQLVRFPRERNFFSLLKDKLSQWSL
ncbi:MAG: NAD(+)/NADH kinase [Christensenellales bacterium]